MRSWKKVTTLLTVALLIFTGCSGKAENGVKSDKEENMDMEKNVENMAVEDNEENMAVEINDVEIGLPKIDNTKWNYNPEDDVYWQVQISYCEKPADTQYETLGIFVPAAYMKAEANGDGTYTCERNPNGEMKGYTASSAPIVVPVNTPGYAAMAAPKDYVSEAAQYTSAGFIYVNAGCRGREAGAPFGVTDLKAAVRYIRYCAEEIPGSTERIFTFGMSGGGAQSALMGSTGDSEDYTPYLEEIGAVADVSDAVLGAMCWCPITNLDYADEAYEWNMGSTRTNLEEEKQKLSDHMAVAFAEYINKLGLTDTNGEKLTLERSESGIYQAGSYYEYIKNVIETSVNHFLSDTEFPYTFLSFSEQHGGSEAIGEMGTMGRIEKIGMKNIPDERKEQFNQRSGDAPHGMDERHGGYIDENGEFQEDGVNRKIPEENIGESKICQTAQEYIDALNVDGAWIIYDSNSNTASIASVEDFAKVCKKASKEIGAFDDLNVAQAENILFGYGDGKGAHFDSCLAELLKGTEYEASFTEDMAKKDRLGNTVEVRVNMYNPLYYLCDYYKGYRTSNVAKYWRIRTGINQGDTALTTEVNLALALENYKDISVDFETVWNQGHDKAERTGNSVENFIAWVNACVQDGIYQ